MTWSSNYPAFVFAAFVAVMLPLAIITAQLIAG